MSNAPSRASSYGNPQRPSTPDRTGRTSRSGSYAVAPKSEYLRNALEARRAQHTPTASLQAVQPPPSPAPAPKPAEVKTPTRASPDVFAEFALSEEQQTPVSPIRRRRPSDVGIGMPRAKTNRELTNELDKLKEQLMTSNLRVELLKSSNSELQQNLTSAKEQVERLEPLEDENYELRTENHQLKLKVENMHDEIARLKDDNEDHRKTNEELTAIASESAAHWEAHEFAIEEAAECIIKMEEEKALLSTELQQLQERVMALESTSSSGSALADGPGSKYPSRVYSVDESRPSTSHFDSDYYSQPSSPQAQPSSSESVRSFTPSERSRKFLDLTEERRKSARDLMNRMSTVSLRALREASPSSPAPQVPSIPQVYQRPMPVPIIVQNDRSETPGSNSARYRRDYEAMPPPPLMEAAKISSPVRPHTVVPQAQQQPDGLRGLYHPERRSSTRTSSHIRPSSMHVASSTNTGLSRSSSNHTTGSANERLQRTLRHRPSSASMRSPTTSTISSEWELLASPNPHPVVSLSPSSQADLSAEVVDLYGGVEDKDRWWRSIDRLTLSQVLAAQSQLQHSAKLSNEPTDPSVHHHHLHQQLYPEDLREPKPRGNTAKVEGEELKRYEIRGTTASGEPFEKDFLFNANESEEQFMQKARDVAASSSSSMRLPKKKP